MRVVVGALVICASYWCHAAEAVRALVLAEVPAEAPTRPDRKMTPSPFAAVKPALEAGREAAGLDQEPKP